MEKILRQGRLMCASIEGKGWMGVSYLIQQSLEDEECARGVKVSRKEPILLIYKTC